jgi:hypothetical protein
VGDAIADGYDEVDDDEVQDAVEHSEAVEMKHPSPLRKRVSLPADADEEKEAAMLAKVMAKMDKPEKFSGETEPEREEVDSWVDEATAWLNSQFRPLDGYYPEAEWEMALSLLKGTAKRYMKMAKASDPSQTWETLKGGFIEFIRGGQESRTLWMVKMDKLVYGSGKCKDLLALEKEFEQLRIKLYPTSSTDKAMNAVVGRLYGQAIERGDLDLYREMQRILMTLPLQPHEEPSLSHWKNAAVKAAQIQKINTVSSQRRGGRYGNQPHWRQDTRTPGATVNEVSEDVEEDGDADDPGAAAVQQMQGRKGPNRNFKPPVRVLTDEQYRKVMEKGLCLQCYQPGHRIRDTACKEKGQKRRKPTAEELKVILKE